MLTTSKTPALMSAKIFLVTVSSRRSARAGFVSSLRGVGSGFSWVFCVLGDLRVPPGDKDGDTGLPLPSREGSVASLSFWVAAVCCPFVETLHLVSA